MDSGSNRLDGLAATTCPTARCFAQKLSEHVCTGVVDDTEGNDTPVEMNQHARDTAVYLADLLRSSSALALAAGLHDLAYLIGMACLEAENLAKGEKNRR